MIGLALGLKLNAIFIFTSYHQLEIHTLKRHK